MCLLGEGTMDALDHLPPTSKKLPSHPAGASAEVGSQDCVSAGCQFQKVNESQKVLGQLEKPQSVPKRCRIDNNGIVFFGLQGIMNCQKRRDFRHAGQGGVDQRFDIVA